LTRSAWVTADPTEYWKLPAVPAVYAVTLNGRVVYVGQSTNLFKRFNAYRMRMAYGEGTLTPWGQVVGIVAMKYSRSRRFGDWAMRELRLIRRLRPEWNCVGSTAKRRSTGKYRGKQVSRTTNQSVKERLQ
jgi:excinuclease UvrABC nuclease subunit